MNLKRKFLPTLMVVMICTALSFAQDVKITVLNPRGNPPPIPLIPMAPRPDSLDAKTIYFVDIKYEGGASLLRAIMEWFTQNKPAAKLVMREKAGSFDQEDAKLWSEIKEKADAVVVAVGH